MLYRKLSQTNKDPYIQDHLCCNVVIVL